MVLQTMLNIGFLQHHFTYLFILFRFSSYFLCAGSMKQIKQLPSSFLARVNTRCHKVLCIAIVVSLIKFSLSIKRKCRTVLLKKNRQVFAATLFLLFYMIICSEDNCVFSADLGNLRPSSSRHTGVWICWRTLPSFDTG